MRIIFVFILIFSIFSDFASASFENEEGILNCKSTSSCEQVDLHDSNETNHGEEHNDHHCHIGHAHLFVLNENIIEIFITRLDLTLNTPKYLVRSLSSFHNQINRPPIV
jgi:hypothetical protein